MAPPLPCSSRPGARDSLLSVDAEKPAPLPESFPCLCFCPAQLLQAPSGKLLRASSPRAPPSPRAPHPLPRPASASDPPAVCKGCLRGAASCTRRRCVGPGTRVREFPRGSDFALIQGASSRPRAARNGFSGAAARPARRAPPAVRPPLCAGRVFRFPVHVPLRGCCGGGAGR